MDATFRPTAASDITIGMELGLSYAGSTDVQPRGIVTWLTDKGLAGIEFETDQGETFTLPRPHHTYARKPAPTMYRVTYVRTGEGRRTKTMTLEDLRWYQGAWYTGIRVTSYRQISN